MYKNKWYSNAKNTLDCEMNLATITDAYFSKIANFEAIDIILKREDNARTRWYVSSLEWSDFFRDLSDDISFLDNRNDVKLKETLCGKVIETYSQGDYLRCISTVEVKKSLLAKCEEYLRKKNNGI